MISEKMNEESENFMIEKRSHFNRFGVLTAKFIFKSDDSLEIPEFTDAVFLKINDYFENEYSASADRSYEASNGGKIPFKPYILSAECCLSEKSGKRKSKSKRKIGNESFSVKISSRGGRTLRSDAAESFEEIHRTALYSAKKYYNGVSGEKKKS